MYKKKKKTATEQEHGNPIAAALRSFVVGSQVNRDGRHAGASGPQPAESDTCTYSPISV